MGDRVIVVLQSSLAPKISEKCIYELKFWYLLKLKIKTCI